MGYHKINTSNSFGYYYRITYIIFALYAFSLFAFIPAKASSMFEQELRRFNLAPEKVEMWSLDTSTESQKLIARQKSGEIMVFDYASKRLVSKTLPNGNILDEITHELLKTTKEKLVYDVYKENKFVYKIWFLKDGGHQIFDGAGKLIQHIDKNNAKRYLKDNFITTNITKYNLLFYRLSEEGSSNSVTEKKATDHYNRGCDYADKGDYDQAISEFNKALELNPKFAEVYNNRGIAYKNKRLYDQAISDFNKAIETNPKLTAAYTNRKAAYEAKDSNGYAQTKDVNTLIKELKDKDPNVRSKAARQLGNLNDDIAVEPLIAALKDGDKYVRMYAVRALGKIVIQRRDANFFVFERQKVINPISAAIEDKEHIVRLEALKVLQKIFD